MKNSSPEEISRPHNLCGNRRNEFCQAVSLAENLKGKRKRDSDLYTAESMHIQDNHGKRDEHLLPGDGTIDWKAFLNILNNIGYQGDLVLEAHHQTQDAPDEERKAILAELLFLTQKMKRYLETLGIRN